MTIDGAVKQVRLQVGEQFLVEVPEPEKGWFLWHSSASGVYPREPDEPAKRGPGKVLLEAYAPGGTPVAGSTSVMFQIGVHPGNLDEKVVTREYRFTIAP